MSQSKFINLKNYQLLERIGEGSFAIVYKIIDNSSKRIYAAKICKDEANVSTIKSEEDLLLFREVNLLASINHPSIIRFIGFNIFSFKEAPNPIIITEYAKNESLRRVINLENKGLSLDGWDDTKKLINIYGIASGMMYLHKHNIIHRDLKPENILIDDCLCPRIADFGLSKVTTTFSEETNTATKSMTSNSHFILFQSQNKLKGTPVYMAPESLIDQIYSPAGDVYAFSLIMYEILTGQKPFQDLDQLKLFRNVAIGGLRPKFTPDIPEAFQDLISKCWSADPKERPIFEFIVNELRDNLSLRSDLVDDGIFEDYVSIIDQYKTSFDTKNSPVNYDEMIKKYFKTVDIKNDLKINHLYVMTTVKDQMIIDLDPLINDVAFLYGKYGHSYIRTVIDMLHSFVHAIDQQNSHFLRSIPIVNGQIDFENYFKIPNTVFDKMSAKVFELIMIMDNAGENGVTPLTEMMIQKVFCSLIRRILFIASEDVIKSIFDKEKDCYPFVNIDISLKNLMYQVFLKIYFSKNRKFLVPFYIYISLAFTLDMSFMTNKKESLIYFNHKFALNSNNEKLSGINLYKNLLIVATKIIRTEKRQYLDSSIIKLGLFNRIINMFENEMMTKQFQLSQTQKPSHISNNQGAIDYFSSNQQTNPFSNNQKQTSHFPTYQNQVNHFQSNQQINRTPNNQRPTSQSSINKPPINSHINNQQTNQFPSNQIPYNYSLNNQQTNQFPTYQTPINYSLNNQHTNQFPSNQIPYNYSLNNQQTNQFPSNQIPYNYSLNNQHTNQFPSNQIPYNYSLNNQQTNQFSRNQRPNNQFSSNQQTNLSLRKRRSNNQFSNHQKQTNQSSNFKKYPHKK